MPRPEYPPYGFSCPYTNNCPHLNGLSAKWVFDEYQRAGDVYQEHLRIINNYSDSLRDSEARVRVLERENAELRAKYQALHRKQFKPNRNNGDGPDSKNGREKEEDSNHKKKRGAPVGHPGWVRAIPAHIDRIVPVPAPEVCPHCGSKDLMPEQAMHEHIQEDVVVKPRTVVTKFVHEEAFCRSCKRSVAGTGPDEIPNAPIGPFAKSTAGYLRYEIGISYRKVQRILGDLFGLSCVPASLVGFDRRAAGRGEAIY